MYFLKRAFKYLKNKKGKTLLLGIIFLVIANFVLAGLLVQNASQKAQKQTRISIGADVNYVMDWTGFWNDVERGVVDYDMAVSLKTDIGRGVVSKESLTQGGGPTYENFMKVVDSDYVESYYVSISFGVMAEDLMQYTLDTREQSGGASTFDAKLHIESEPADFNNGNAELISGRYADQNEVESGANVVLIEENIARLNNLRLGDTISVSTSILDYNNAEADYEIIGIYRTNEQVNPKDSLPQNRFYVPFNSLRSIGLTQNEINNLLVSPNVISLKDPLDVDSFKQEAEAKINLKYGSVDANDALYNRLIGPIESLGQISGILVIIIAVAGALIIGLITALTVNERKEEIGILLAVGESKLKIVSQFVLEVTIIAVVAFALSSFTGSYVGDNISETVLDSELLETQDSAYPDKGYYGKGYSKNQKDVESIVEKDAAMDISLNTTVLLQLFGLGLLLSVLSTVIPSLYVMRFNPKQILTNRSS